MQTESNLIDLKAKNKLNISKIFSKNKNEDEEVNEQMGKKNEKENLIPVFEEDV